MTDNAEKARNQWNRYLYCRDNGHEAYTIKSRIMDGFFDGSGQWDEQDRRALDAQGRPCETVNNIMPKINNIVGHQIENQAEVVYKPRDNVADPKVATTITKTAKQVFQNNAFHELETDVFEDGMIGSRGFFEWEVEWEAPNVPGDIKASKKDPRTIVIDPDAHTYEPEGWRDVTEARYLSYNEIERIFGRGKAKELEHKQLGNDHDTLGWESIKPTGFGQQIVRDQAFVDNDALRRLPNIMVLSRQYKEMDKVSYFIDPDTNDTSVVPYNWDDDRVEFVRQRHGLLVATMPKMRIKHMITADDVLLFDDWSIYRTYTIIPYFALFRWGRTIGWVENLVGPQRVLNKMTSQELHILNTTANSGWMIEQDSLVNMDKDDLENDGAQTGIILEYHKGATPPEKIKPNPLPQGHERMAFRAEDNIKEISTVGDSQMGFDREDVAAKAIIAKQSRGSVNLNRVMSNLDKTRRLCGLKVLELIQDFYTEERVMRITGDNPFGSATESQDLQLNQPQGDGSILNDLSIGEYDLVVSSTPMRDTLMDTEFEQGMRMREAGIAIPDSVMIRNSNLANKDEIQQMMAEDPIAARLKELEVKQKEVDIVNGLADAKKKDAEAAAKMREANSPIEDTEDNAEEDRILKLAKAADDLHLTEMRNKQNAANQRRRPASAAG